MSPTWNELLEDAKNSGAGFDPLPVGQYNVKVSKSAHKISQTNKSMFEVEMTIVSGPHANRKVWDRYVVTPDNPKALAFFFSKMKVLGLTTEFFAAQPTDEQVANALVDRMCTVELSQTEYNGSVRNEVRKIIPLIGIIGEAPPIPPATAAGAPPVPPAPSVPTAPPVPAAPTVDAAPPVPPAPPVAPIVVEAPVAEAPVPAPAPAPVEAVAPPVPPAPPAPPF